MANDHDQDHEESHPDTGHKAGDETPFGFDLHFPQWPFNEMVSGHRQKSCRKQGKEAQSHWHIGSKSEPST